VYQVGHHGSSTSTTGELLAAVDPQVAVYSAGAENHYGHPHDEVVDRIIEADIELYGTDVHGTITVTTDGLTWSVSTERDEPPVSDPGGPSGRDPPATTAPPTITMEPTTTTTTPTTSTTSTTAEPSTHCEPGEVDVNTATFDELQRILHIGPERAQQIIELRPFGSVEAMTRISGIADARLRDIKQEGVACAS
jgi:competence protein ComEC